MNFEDNQAEFREIFGPTQFVFCTCENHTILAYIFAMGESSPQFRWNLPLIFVFVGSEGINKA